ncbi:succinic semialdehyde dehydrogenase [Corynebacterium sp. 335C]
MTTTATPTSAPIRNPLAGGVAERLNALAAVSGTAGDRDVVSPFTGEVIGTVPVGDADDVERAFAEARRAQKSWARVGHKQRREILHRFHNLLMTHQDLVLDVIQAETGKSRASAFEELVHTAITARYYGNKAEKMLAPKRAHGALPVLTHTTVHHHPKGVVGVISPWNYPLTLAVSDAVAALAAGNGVVAKPDSTTPYTALLAVELLYRAGLPRDLFRVVPGPGAVVGQGIVGHADYLMFTGSSETGAQLASQAGERLIDFSAELGGKNALIVAEDADPKKAAQGAIIASFTNSGHLCVSIERIYVADAVWDEFTAEFTDRTKAMTLGAGYGWDVEMGCLQSKGQFDVVAGYVDGAREAGATVLAGGRARPDLGPLFYEPTILADVPEGTPVLTEEVFGPVVVLHRVRDVEEGIERANDSDYGLNASLWTSPKRARELAPRIEAGSVNVNDGFAASFASVDAPMGGFKKSGAGRRQGEHGLLKYTESQTVAVQRLSPISFPFLERSTYAKTFSTALTLGKKFGILP